MNSPIPGTLLSDLPADVIDLLSPEELFSRSQPRPARRPVRNGEVRHSVGRALNDHHMMRSLMQILLTNRKGGRFEWAEDHGLDCSPLEPPSANAMLEHALKLTDWLE